jgi:Predicted membrane protein
MEQLNKEAKWTLAIAIIYYAFIFGTSYIFRYSEVRVWGFPLWIFCSSLVGWIAMSVVGAIVVKTVFKEIDINAYSDPEQDDREL